MSIDKLLLPRYLLNDTYPYPESSQLEFKKSFHVNQTSKYRETICAFLNTEGGHIIYGILDNCVINGCTLTELEKDTILLFVDGIYTILKNTDGGNIPKDAIKVYFEEIAKNMYIVIISCYKLNNTNEQYQFLGGDSWIRMNASNMKMNVGKLYTVQDVSTIKSKFYKKCEESIVRIKKDYERSYNKCEADTIIYISDIFDNKVKKEKEMMNIGQNKYKLFSLYFISIFINIYFLLKSICV